MREYPGSTLHEFVKGRYGVGTRTVESRVVVGATAVTLLRNNPRRLAWLLVNRSVNPGAIGFDETVTYDNGLFVGGDGGCVSMNAEEDGEAVGQAVYAILSSGTGVWYVWELMTA